MGPGSTWRLPSNTSSWLVASDSTSFQTKYMSQFSVIFVVVLRLKMWGMCTALCRLVGAPVSATRFLAGSVWRPASFSSSSLMMSFFISTGEITSIILGFYFPTASRATTTMTTCSTSTTDKLRQLLAIIRFEAFWGESNGQKSCIADFIWCSLIKCFLWNIGGRGDLPEYHLGEVEVRLRLPVLARKMFHYEWKG